MRVHRLTQKQIAAALGYNQGWVSRVIRGKHIIHDLRQIRAIAVCLNIPLHLLRINKSSASFDGLTVTANSLPDHRETENALTFGPYSGSRPRCSPVKITKDMVTMAADEPARFAWQTEASHIGSLSLDHLDADVRALARAYFNQPLSELFVPNVQLRNAAFSLLERNRYPEQTKHLYLLAGQLCLLLAHAPKDLHNLAAAQTQTRTAWLCAQLADHHDLRAWVSAHQGIIAYWEGRYQDSLRLVQDGQRFGARGVATVFLPSLQARAAGQLADARIVREAFTAAQTAREQLQPDDLAGGIFLIPPAEQAMYFSEAYLSLGEPHQAEQQARYAITSYQAEPAEDLFLDNLHAAQCDLATALLDQGHLDGAQQALHPVLATPAQRRPLPLTRGLLTFDHKLLASSGDPRPALARQLHDEITEFRTHPLNPHLPAV